MEKNVCKMTDDSIFLIDIEKILKITYTNLIKTLITKYGFSTIHANQQNAN